MWIRGNRVVSALLALGVTAAASGCSLIPKEEEVLPPPLYQPQKEQFTLHEVQRGEIVKQVKGTAFFASTRIAYHEFAAAGRVASVEVKYDDKVKKGDVLIRLETAEHDVTLMERERDYEVARLALFKAKESGDEQQVRIKQKELEIAKVKLDEVRKMVQGRVLTAQMDGVVTRVEALKVGDAVTLGKSYVDVADTSQLRLEYQMGNSVDVAEIQIGMPAEVTYKGEKLRGKVVQTPATAPKTENKQLQEKYAKTLYIELEQVPAQARIGDTADITVVTKRKDNVVKIPTRGLQTYLGRNYVRVMEGESIKEIDVEKGIETTTEVEIVKGLKEGQKVILP